MKSALIKSGDGSRERPFVTHSSSYIAAAIDQCTILESMSHDGALVIHERIYDATAADAAGSKSSVAYHVRLNGRATAVHFDFSDITLELKRKAEGERAVKCEKTSVAKGDSPKINGTAGPEEMVSAGWRYASVILLLSLLFMAHRNRESVSDRDGTTPDYAAGYSDGRGAAYNTVKRLRGSIIKGDWGNKQYAQGYADGCDAGIREALNRD